MSAATVKKTPEGAIIWSNQYGFKNRESQTAVDSETSFWAASVSKAVLGTTIMIASEDGFLNLDSDVHTVLDNQGSFSLNNPDQLPISIAQLASHTSGIIDELETYACGYYVPTANGGHDKLTDSYDVGISCPADSPVTLAGFLGAYLDTDGQFYDTDDNFAQQDPGEYEDYSKTGAGLAGT